MPLPRGPPPSGAPLSTANTQVCAFMSIDADTFKSSVYLLSVCPSVRPCKGLRISLVHLAQGCTYVQGKHRSFWELA